jgi:N-methylhydantoinase A
MSAILGIDVGGTFTDVVVLRDNGRDPLVDKLLSTPGDPSIAVIDAIRRLRDIHGLKLDELSLFAHGSTIATNALLEFKIARTALVVTKGFRDVLEIGTQIRSTMFDLTLIKPRTIVPRNLVFEVDERLDRLGNVVRPLKEEEIAKLIREIEEVDIDACAISFLFSFHNPEHEIQVAEALKLKLPHLAVTVSHEVSPEIKEYPRTSTTAISAALQPLVSHYIKGIEDGLLKEDAKFPFFVMQSSGGVMSADEAKQNAHRMILSGPAAGVIAGTRLAESSPYKNQITFDMGGTSTDICLIYSGRPRVEYESLFNGRPLKVPQFDIHTIGSGGGSIARVDVAGLLHVGPESAGAVPGPACYGTGGTEPTVTDAHLVLGRIHPEHFLGGDIELDKSKAEEVIGKKIAHPLNINIEEAALGILDVADAVMARGVRVVSVNRGYDPRDFTLVAFGGAGPMHALTVGQLVDVKSVLIPLRPGTFSAVGLASSDLKYTFSQPVDKPLEQIDANYVENQFSGLIRRALVRLERVGESTMGTQFVRLARFRYPWQDNAVEVQLGTNAVHKKDLEDAVHKFHEQHAFEFGHSDPSESVELVAIGLEAYGELWHSIIQPVSELTEYSPQSQTMRKVYFRDYGWFETPIYDRAEFIPGASFIGPAIVEEHNATTIVTPHAKLLVDEFHNLRLNAI